MKTYRLSAAGRRVTLTMLVSVALVWLFAVAMLPATLGIRYIDLLTTLGAAAQAGWGPGQLFPAGILLIMLVAAPLLGWSLLEELWTTYRIEDTGLTYSTLPGIRVCYPWNALRELRQATTGETLTKLVVSPDELRQIRNPVARWLHRQAFGAATVPIYAGIEARDELVAEIVHHWKKDERPHPQPLSHCDGRGG